MSLTPVMTVTCPTTMPTPWVLAALLVVLPALVVLLVGLVVLLVGLGALAAVCLPLRRGFRLIRSGLR